jgi:hypothetical protein
MFSFIFFDNFGGMGRDPKVSKLLFPASFFIGSPVVVIIALEKWILEVFISSVHWK